MDNMKLGFSDHCKLSEVCIAFHGAQGMSAVGYLVVAIAVAHGMSVLTLDDRPVLCGDIGKG